MKLLIFGASGGTGQKLVMQALEQGHFVTAFVRDSAYTTISHNNLKLIQGDVLDYSSVLGAVKGQDVIISALGIKILKKNTIISDGTGNIIKSMEENGVKRFICLSAIGVGSSKAQQKQLGPLYNFFIIPVVIRNMFDDKEVQERYIAESNLSWTIVRAAILTNRGRTGNRLSFEPNDTSIKAKISRSDVADFMLRQIEDKSNICKAVSISN